MGIPMPLYERFSKGTRWMLNQNCTVEEGDRFIPKGAVVVIEDEPYEVDAAEDLRVLVSPSGFPHVQFTIPLSFLK